jgi:hypothetical protein
LTQIYREGASQMATFCHIVHYFGAESTLPQSKYDHTGSGHYIGNRVPFGTLTESALEGGSECIASQSKYDHRSVRDRNYSD